jgi:hypothetical protein
MATGFGLPKKRSTICNSDRPIQIIRQYSEPVSPAGSFGGSPPGNQMEVWRRG